MDWEDLRHFAALAEHRTLSAAARALGTSHVTVARRLARLEAQLGGPLFDRRAGYVPTSRGLAVLAKARLMAEASADIAAATAEAQDRPIVRLSVPRTMGDRFLIPRLSPRTADLGVELHIDMQTRLVSLARSEADIAVRLGHPESAEIVGRRVAMIEYGLFRHPDLHSGDTAPIIAPEEGDDSTEWLWFWARQPARRVAMRVNSQVAQLAAAEAKAGVALLPRFLVGPNSPLIEVALPASPPGRPVWLLARRTSLKSPAIRRVYDALRRLYDEEF